MHAPAGPADPAREPADATVRWRVRVGAGGPAFEAAAGQPLLAAAEAAGLPWASSCRNGTCRTCLRRLQAGRVVYRIDWPGVLAEERAAGWMLPCVAHAASDLVVEDTAAGGQSLPVT